MATFKYVGDPNDNFSGPDTVVFHGLVFRKGETVEVPDPPANPADDSKDKDAKANRERMNKLKGNSHYVDMSDQGRTADVEERQKTIEKREADREKAAEEHRKRDAEDAAAAEERRRELEKNPPRVTAENTPRPPGNITREPVRDGFQGRTVEQRTPAEDHTRSGKTKG